MAAADGYVLSTPGTFESHQEKVSPPSLATVVVPSV